MNFAGIIRLNKCGATVFFVLFCMLLLYVVKRSTQVHETTDVVSLRKLLTAAIEVAEQGGKEVVSVRNLPDVKVESKGKTKEGANDPLTNADKKSHCIMYFGLLQAFPKVKVISEEDQESKDCNHVQLLELDPRGLDGQSNLVDENVPVKDVTVWIDPLDATQEFTENLLPYVTTMVCVTVAGKPIIGVIHKPFGDEPRTTWSWLDRAVSADLKKSNKDSASDVPLSIIVSRSHAGKVLQIAKKALGSNTSIIPAGGAGYKVLEVIAGNVTAYVHTTNIKKWDICAGNAIINAAGGQMTTLKNEPIDYSSDSDPVNSNGLIATMSSSKHSLIVEKLSSVNL